VEIQKLDFTCDIQLVYWATVCKTVRIVPSYRCLSCLSSPVLSVTVYCGQTVGRIKMKLGMQI